MASMSKVAAVTYELKMADPERLMILSALRCKEAQNPTVRTLMDELIMTLINGAP